MTESPASQSGNGPTATEQPGKVAASASRLSTDAERADILFGGTDALKTQFRGPLKDSIGRISDAEGWDGAAREAYLGEMSHAFTDARVRSTEAGVLHDLLAKHTVTPASDAEMQAWTMEVNRELRQRFEHRGGDKEIARRWHLVREYVRNRPEVAKRLNATGVGSHPRWVLALMENADHLQVEPRKRKN